jgi:MerR family transcriptional regulator, copper efflux regulator
MRISELAQRTGVSAHALRHYERLGLLRPGRTAGGYRDYPESARREVVFIAMSRKIGFSLKDVAGHMPAYRSGRLSFDDMVDAMHRRIAEIDRSITALRAQRAEVVDHVRWLREQKKKHRHKTSHPPKDHP